MYVCQPLIKSFVHLNNRADSGLDFCIQFAVLLYLGSLHHQYGWYCVWVFQMNPSHFIQDRPACHWYVLSQNTRIHKYYTMYGACQRVKCIFSCTSRALLQFMEEQGHHCKPFHTTKFNVKCKMHVCLPLIKIIKANSGKLSVSTCCSVNFILDVGTS